jgi:adenylate cyclase
MGMGSSFTFALPITGLIFVILIYASLRYRPWLIVYATALFLTSVNLGSWVMADDVHVRGPMGQMNMAGLEASMRGEGMAGLMNFQVLPVTLILLSALILFVGNRRTKSLLYQAISQTQRAAKLSRFFSPNLAEELAERGEDRLLAGRRQNVAVLFIDIRDFTSLGETLRPDELGALLSEYRNRLTQPIFRHGGTVDKFIGDAIMAVFGTPIRHGDDARRAMVCALEMLDAAADWAGERTGQRKPPIGIGIGAHYGEVFAGALGNEQLLEYTVIGDTVNVAERLERLSRTVDSSLVVSGPLMQEVSDAECLAEWRQLPQQQLKGHRQPVSAYCVVSHGKTGSFGTNSSP